MAVKTFTVIYDRSVSNSVSKDVVDQTKAQAEALHAKTGKEPITFGKNTEKANLVSVTAENAEAAVIAARLLLGISENQGKVCIVETSKIEEKDAR